MNGADGPERDGDGDGHGHDHGSARALATGFVLSIVLTAAAFAAAMSAAVPRALVVQSLLAAGVTQIVVHVVFFLHLNRKAEGGWNALVFGFTVLITVILVAGSMWIMGHLDRNMMLMPP
jgi:cytochrome o ubiquinol oxidase operon protein cyoD